jgi:hypothetical protein
MTKREKREVARRATANYFGLGIDHSYLEFVDNPRLQNVPAIKMINCIIQALDAVEKEPLTAEDLNAEHLAMHAA